MKILTCIAITLVYTSLHCEGASEIDYDSLLEEAAKEGLLYAKKRVELEHRLRTMNIPAPKKTFFDMKRSTYTKSLGEISFQARARLHAGQKLVEALNIERSKIPSFLEGVSVENTLLGKSCRKEAKQGPGGPPPPGPGGPLPPGPGGPLPPGPGGPAPTGKPPTGGSTTPPPRSVEYRSYDGSGNNLAHTDWGKAETVFRRILTPEYGNGLNTPRGTGTGQSLPSARLVSELVTADLDKPFNAWSLMTMQWGQFLDHDITETPTSTNQGAPIVCCQNNSVIPEASRHPECFPITIPSNDPFYGPFSTTCMNFVRSECGITGDCTIGVRQQINGLTAFIDASNVYGNNEEKAKSLRSFTGGKLKMSNTDDHPLLPTDPAPCPISQVVCYVAGDARVNEQVDLTIMHTLWAREHNRIAGILAKMKPNWDDEKLYQETRRIVGAQMQHITYSEFLPIVLGKTVMQANGLLPAVGYSNQYDSNLDPSIANAFSTAAYRFGHSLIDGMLKMYNTPTEQVDSLIFHKQFFNPSPVTSADKFLQLINGLNFQPAQRVDHIFTTSVTEHLFEANGKFGADLVARNIQRGRDHGLPSYVKWRKYCNVTWNGTFQGLASNIPPNVVKSLNTAYNGKADDIDLFIGGISETPYLDGVVGQTFNCILTDTFRRLRKADRFFYEEKGPQGFTEPQLKELKKISLAKVICNNGGVKAYPKIAFGLPSPDKNPVIDCSKIVGMNLQPWA